MFKSLTENVQFDNQDLVYTEMNVAAGYDFEKDEYVKERKNFFGGSLKKKRKTLRRKSKRFTKRRTNKKKRLTNKRRTNKKKRLTKRR